MSDTVISVKTPEFEDTPLAAVSFCENGYITTSVSTLEAKLTPSIPEGVHIKIFGQVHDYNTPTNAVKEDVSRNQFEVLRFIMNNRDSLIFPEGVTENFANPAANPKFKNVIQETKALFSSGVPEKFEDLTERQKIHLQIKSGALVASFLGIVDRLCPVTTSEKVRESMSKIKELGDKNEFVQAVGDVLVRTGVLPKPSQELLESGKFNSALRRYYRDPIVNFLLISKFYEDNPGEVAPDNVKKILTEFREVLADSREKELERQIAITTNLPENKGKDVVIIFGKSHIPALNERFAKYL